MTSYVSPIPFTTVAQSIPPNVFAEMDRKVAAAVAGGVDVIDLAKGNPDAFPADFIRDVARRTVDDPTNARYSPFDGKPSFLQAAQAWYRNTYDVDVDWKTQLFAVEGAVDGLAALFAVLVSPGDAVAYADPYYPSYHCMTVMSQAEEVLLPSLPERGFLPDLDAVPADTWNRVKVLVLNYPNNPTAPRRRASFWNVPSNWRMNTISQSCRISHTRDWACVSSRSASCRCRVPSTWPSKCARCRKCMRWPAGEPVSLPA